MSQLKNILDIVSASGEESDDVLMDLLKPEKMTREEAQVAFDNALGYDPTTFFDRRDIEEHVESFIADDLTPANISSIVADDKATIVDMAFEKFDDARQEHLATAVSEAVYDATVWDLSDDEDSESDDDDEEEYDDMDDDEWVLIPIRH